MNNEQKVDLALEVLAEVLAKLAKTDSPCIVKAQWQLPLNKIREALRESEQEQSESLETNTIYSGKFVPAEKLEQLQQLVRDYKAAYESVDGSSAARSARYHAMDALFSAVKEQN